MIVLTHGYFLQDDEKEKAIMKPYPPLGILYLSAYMEEKGFEHDVFDTTFSSREKFNEYLLEKMPAILAIYINLMTKVNVVKTIQFVRSQPSLQHTKIVLGGPDVRYNKENLLHRGADFLVIGEGEETFYELVTALYGNQSYRHSIIRYVCLLLIQFIFLSTLCVDFNVLVRFLSQQQKLHTRGKITQDHPISYLEKEFLLNFF